MSLGLVTPELHYNRGSAFFALGRLDQADAELVSAIRLRPDYLDAQEFLAKLRYMRGEEDYTREIASAASAVPEPQLAMLHGDLLRRGGHLEVAEGILRDILEKQARVPEVASSLAVVLQEQGRLEEALKYAHSANVALPDNPDIAENLVAILLQLGDTRTCAPLIQLWRKRDSLDQRWLAYEATAARLSGDARYEELYDYKRFTMPYDLQPPRGYSSIDEFHAELIPHLVQLHRLATHPLDQSLRHGTQTATDLRVDSSDVLQGFFEALQEPIREYRSRLGYDPNHPFLKRNRGDSEFAGCWSVRLAQQGYHVNHIHPKGWISSAYYVEVPSEVQDEGARSGWLKFGEPRMPTPGADAAHWAKPKAGRLVLFPSYMWHGTVPIESDQPRMTIAFDVVTK
jgi:tetratricopeptide (TPR) repeat protein